MLLVPWNSHLKAGSHAGSHVHQHMAMQHPHSGIVSHKAEYHMPLSRYADSVFSKRPLSIPLAWRIALRSCIRVIAAQAAAFSAERGQHMERVSVKVERMRAIVKVVNHKLDSGWF